MQGMDIDEDFVTRFIWHEDVVFVIRIFESELCKFQRVFSGEPDRSNVFDKLLCVGRVKCIIVWTLNRGFGSEEIQRCARVKSVQEVGRREFRGSMRGVVVRVCKIG